VCEASILLAASDKTRFVDFRSNRPDGSHPETDGMSFTFLGFCRVWRKLRKGKNVVRQVTVKSDTPRAGGSSWRRRHQPFPERPGPRLDPTRLGGGNGNILTYSTGSRQVRAKEPPKIYSLVRERGRRPWAGANDRL
jgi:hypothetical protein